MPPFSFRSEGKLLAQEKLGFSLFLFLFDFKMQQAAAGSNPVLTPSGSPLKYAGAPAT
jgi:hypothetical protein